ncbi:MAG: hypothetical protein JSV22_08785 [Bacteroidales bacterium]|nr:MAG: hypothetical protein JSV22_08785 [Bacteroidales bacterium]
MNDLFMLFVLFLFVSCNQKKSEPRTINKSEFEFSDLHNFRWKSSKISVLANEPSLFYTRDTIFEYLKGSIEIVDFDTDAVFQFKNDTLIQSQYIFKKIYYYTTQYISDYELIKNALKNKYGAPVIDNYNWTNSLFRSYPDYWGVSLTLGHLACESAWKLEDSTRIYLMLHRVINNNTIEIEHSVKFASSASIVSSG